LAEQLATGMIKYNLSAIKIFRNISWKDFLKYNFNELNALLPSNDSLPSGAYLLGILYSGLYSVHIITAY